MQSRVGRPYIDSDPASRQASPSAEPCPVQKARSEPSARVTSAHDEAADIYRPVPQGLPGPDRTILRIGRYGGDRRTALVPHDPRPLGLKVLQYPVAPLFLTGPRLGPLISVSRP